MKTITLFLSLVLVSWVTASVYGQTNGFALVTSPDHPDTWVVGASNIHQDLRWDNTHQMLVADVTYSTRDWADGPHPTQDSDYTLSFPTVRLEKSSGILTTDGTKIGRVTHGLFGSDVVLSNEAELNIHRHHGKIFATIAPKVGE